MPSLPPMERVRLLRMGNRHLHLTEYNRTTERTMILQHLRIARPVMGMAHQNRMTRMTVGALALVLPVLVLLVLLVLPVLPVLPGPGPGLAVL